jgi:hypothetical protein
MFEQIIESLKKATEMTAQSQQELFKKWVGLFNGTPPAPPFTEGFAKFQKKYAEALIELSKKYQQTIDEQYAIGLKTIEQAFQVTQVKDPEELKAKTIELWQKIFETVRKGYELQARDFQTTVGKFAEVFTAA